MKTILQDQSNDILIRIFFLQTDADVSISGDNELEERTRDEY